ncbi:MAG: protein kinase [Clostridiales bacterium]|jgi:serine/threonine-protein kinase|nr:protein kinase [Clostridiales bacterium]
MYIDYILIAVGSVTAIAFICIAIYLIVSNKKSSFYREILEVGTTTIDITETSKRLGVSTTGAELLTVLEANSEEVTGTVLDDTLPPGSSAAVGTGTDILGVTRPYNLDFPAEFFEKYTVCREISGGGMSRVFLALNKKLQNYWIVKFVDSRNGIINNEGDILKRLNHLNLPAISDIFYGEKGVFIVERYVEGITLDLIIKSKQTPGQFALLQWFEQLIQVLKYLHSLEPAPIIHCDLKPSNIILTHANNLVLIDFGISKTQGSDEGVSAVTYKYAAPEQLKRAPKAKYAEIIKERFGDLPEERFGWQIDERTDIYSLGVIFFELITGSVPTVHNKGLLREKASAELAAVIEKCLELNPQNRYQSADELFIQIQKLQNTRLTMAKTLTLRRALVGAAVFLVILSSGSISVGAFMLQQENLTQLAMDPNTITLSLQQSAEFAISRQQPNGKTEDLDLSWVTWDFSDNIARIDGNRIVGVNTGETTITGKYRNKVVDVNVNVVEPVNGLVNVSLKYSEDTNVNVFAGNGERDTVDGSLNEAAFVSPESISANGSAIYLADSGLLRKIEGDVVSTITLEPDYLKVSKVRSSENGVYILTNPWEGEGGALNYAIIKMLGDTAEVVYYADTDFAFANDFAVSNGKLYLLEYLSVYNATFIREIDEATGEVTTLCEIENDITGMDIDEGTIYLAGGESAVIMTYNINSAELKYVAGTKDNRNFIDGSAPLFYEPMKVKKYNDELYVLDFNVIRKMELKDGVCGFAQTVAGEVSLDLNPDLLNGAGSEVKLAKSSLMEFDFDSKGNIYVTDPKKSVVRIINKEE